MQYAHHGVWLGMNQDRPMLPESMTSLYKDWETSNTRTWAIFRKYLPVYSEICYKDTQSPTDFIYKASMNGSREKAKDHASRLMKKKVLLNEHVTPKSIVEVLPGMLDRRASMALMTMPRLEEANRIDNATFKICLQRKLRLKIFRDVKNYVCKCGKALDEFGDHCLGCTVNSKKIASDGIRDGLIKVFQRVLPVTKMIISATQVEEEPYGIIDPLPLIKPFALSIRLDHSTDVGTWRTPFARIGFDVTLIHSTRPSSSSPSEAAKYTESDLRLRYGERMKFVRSRGGTNEVTKQTLSADQIIGEIVDSNFSFIPIAVGPHGELGSLFRRFLYGTKALPLPDIPKDKPNALRAAQLAVSSKNPSNILGKANKAWKKSNGVRPFSGSYQSSTPQIWAEQHIGLVIQTKIATHIKNSLQKLKYKPGHAPALLPKIRLIHLLLTTRKRKKLIGSFLMVHWKVVSMVTTITIRLQISPSAPRQNSASRARALSGD